MKLLIHAGLFAMGTIRVDTETGAWEFVTEPLINADQAVSSEDGSVFTVEDATKAGHLMLSALNQAAGKWILKGMGIEVTPAPKPEPLPLTNVLGGNGKASA